jgi:hypothetical protein
MQDIDQIIGIFRQLTNTDVFKNNGEIGEQDSGAAAAPAGAGATQNTNKRGQNWKELYTIVRGKANTIDDKTKWESGVKRGISNNLW